MGIAWMRSGDGVEELWSLRDDVLVEDGDDGSVNLISRWGDHLIRKPGAVLRESLHRMRLGPVSLGNVLEPPDGSAGAAAERATLMLALDGLQHLVVRSLRAAQSEPVLLSAEPISHRATFRPRPIDPDTLVRLSRFAVISSDGKHLRVESPLSLHRVWLFRPETSSMFAHLARAKNAAAVAKLALLPAELTLAALAYMVAGGMVIEGEAGDDGPVFAEENDPTLRLWSVPDLAFHTRSTLGRHDEDFGATYRFGDGQGPEPVVKRHRDGKRIALYRPALEDLLAADPPLTAVLESRRSVRRFDPSRFTARDLGEFLYRALRIRAMHGPEDSRPEGATTLDRPYPSGGGIHELEYYVAVGSCDGLERGVYGYDADAHELVLANGSPEPVGRLLRFSRLAAGLDDEPPAVVLVTARFGRIFWKYSGMGYSLVLKHVGVAMQTMYLVGTAMGLGACAIGSSEIEDTSRMLGVDWLAESNVGALVVGRPLGAEANAGFEPPARHAVNDAGWREECAGWSPHAGSAGSATEAVCGSTLRVQRDDRAQQECCRS
jgi:SagB-type dehydrogenase family enzyme